MDVLDSNGRVIGTVNPVQSAMATTSPACDPIKNNNSIYPIPRSFTLAATGADGNVKMQSYDGAVESIQGSLGATSFTVNELPPQAGLDLGGAALLGINVLRRALSVYAVLVDFINYKAGSAAQLTNPLKVYRGSIDGTVLLESKSISTDLNNSQFDPTLVRISGNWLLTSNTALQMYCNNTVAVNLSFKVKNLIPYSQVF